MNSHSATRLGDTESINQWHRRLLAQRTVAALERRGMAAEFLPGPEAARDRVLQLVPRGAAVGLGSSHTVVDCGIYDALRQRGDISLFDRYRAGISRTEREDVSRRALTSDVFITGTNALSADGFLVNIDRTGNRVAGMLFGPRCVIVVCGLNKLTATQEEAVARARHVAAVRNAAPLGLDLPCVRTGTCHQCDHPDSICHSLVIIGRQVHPGRIRVLLIDADLGF